jgi:hypothetical protein
MSYSLRQQKCTYLKSYSLRQYVYLYDRIVYGKYTYTYAYGRYYQDPFTFFFSSVYQPKGKI